MGIELRSAQAPRRGGHRAASQSCAPCPAGRKVGIHTLGAPGEYVYICCGPATFRVVNTNPRAA